MNERIRQLAKQATKEVWGNDPFNGAPTFEGHELDEEKFAELIVRECAKVVNDTEYPYENEADKNTWDTCCVWTAEKLKEHFGVE